MSCSLPDPRPYFAALEDPRRKTKIKLHPLGDIVMLVFCAVLSGIEDWVGMQDFALDKDVWLRGFLERPNGIPSHDTPRGCLETPRSGQALQHEAGHGDVNPAFVRAGEALVALAEAAGVVGPAEGALNHPAPG